MNMPTPDAAAALEAGSIDVALLGGPAGYQAIQDGKQQITDGEGLIEAITCVATTQQFVDEHPDVIEQFNKAQVTIQEMMAEDPEKVKSIVMKELSLTEAAYDDMYAMYDFSTEITDDKIQGLQKTADFMFANDMISSNINAQDLFLQ